MRTTLNLDDDVAEIIRVYAESRAVALGRAASDLIRRGLAVPLETKVVNGFHVAVLPNNSHKVTSENVKRLLDEE